MMRIFVALALGGTACNPSPAPSEPAEDAAVEAPENPEIAADPAPTDPDEAQRRALVPSVLETDKAMRAAGVDKELSTLVVSRPFDLSADAPDRAAVRTGVVLADLLLTVKSSDKERTLDQLSTIRTGMKQLDAGSDIDVTLVDLETRIKAGAVTPDELVVEFDELSGAVIPELEFNGNARAVPLISAGSWLEGTHLVAKALQAVPADKRADAEKLLKAPSVVDYFAEFVAGEANTAPEPVSAQLKTTLATLERLATKAEPLSDEELQQIVKSTGDVLGLL